MSKRTWTLLTPPSQGAIAIIQLAGNVTTTLSQITSRSNWIDGRLYLVDILGIDEAVAVQINNQLAHIMPHGGMQILRKLAKLFSELDIEQTDEPQFPEAQDEIDSAMLRTLSIAESQLSVELLLKQPDKLRGVTPLEDDLNRATILNHLIYPPKVVLLGSPNTGKSTLMNSLTKQDTSIVHDLPGATRDAVGARINCGGLVLDLYDLPGFRDSDDAIEQEAITIAKKIMTEAVLTILIADETHDWFETDNHAIRIATKSDIKDKADSDLCVSAHTGENMEALTQLIRDAIVPPKVLKSDKPWFFPGSYSPTDE
ncbi:MAG: 50S ribosome-binding GTPase [Phycisphaerales bacterium]|nr:50S ribosome-binding GTPase [Planctomycetota bacterium]MBL6997590.1 50S ribosome-binding GTPase [Phycisphaerales bacterium]